MTDRRRPPHTHPLHAGPVRGFTVALLLAHLSVGRRHLVQRTRIARPRVPAHTAHPMRGPSHIVSSGYLPYLGRAASACAHSVRYERRAGFYGRQ